MERTGTEVTREAADLVLTDDNFATLVTAIREGRAIYENIRKTLVYLLVGNVGELTLMLAASLVGLPLPLVPLQLLWINLVTDSLLALALALVEVGPLTNRLLLGIVVFSVVLQGVLYTLPPARELFGLGAMLPWELGLAFALSFLPLTVLEVSKWMRRWRALHSPVGAC
ncbi:MAG TPA: cation transporting ATPase C-terminal domain-containing protein [Archangium sp.]|nr:cation transporting ATPase C-terminal domain-containing protein [Archangium sp.]